MSEDRINKVKELLKEFPTISEEFLDEKKITKEVLFATHIARNEWKEKLEKILEVEQNGS